jgi:DNA-binding NarL/FixJ family response regulator
LRLARDPRADRRGVLGGAIAERLRLAPEDVETEVEQIFVKLGLRDEDASHRRVAAVLTYLRATLRR